MASDRTPVRVRRKHHALEQRQLREASKQYHRKRKLDAMSPVTALDVKMPRRVKRSHLSRLEQLPTELLEFILLYSANLDLPLVSKTLLSQLSNGHVQQLLVDRILQSLTPEALHESQAMLQYVRPLFERRFFTFSVFQQWLARQVAFPPRDIYPESSSHIHTSLEDTQPESLATAYRNMMNEAHYLALTELTIPTRVLTSPFTEDRLCFLRFWAVLLAADRNESSAYHQADEQLREASFVALESHEVEAVRILIRLISVIDDEMIEHVVIQGGCDHEVVESVFNRFPDRGRADPAFNPLNPVLWAWADEPAQVKSGNGEYLKGHLQSLLAKMQSYLPDE